MLTALTPRVQGSESAPASLCGVSGNLQATDPVSATAHGAHPHAVPMLVARTALHQCQGEEKFIGWEGETYSPPTDDGDGPQRW